jgi:putative ABC transport system permease protein
MTGLASARLALRLALRELAARPPGFAVFLVCLALGVGAIAAVSTTARGLTEGIAREGRVILGGDLSLSSLNSPPAARERAAFEALGPISVAATLRGMARTLNGNAQVLAEVKAVDAAYPLAGALVLDPPRPAAEVFAVRDGVVGAAAEAALLDRLGLSVGGRLRLGTGEVEIRAVLVSEPDKLASGLGFGPRLLMSLEAIERTGLGQPGALMRWHVRIALPEAGEARLAAIGADLAQLFPDQAYEARTRGAAAPRLTREIERFTQFLTLVGLTSLLVGGVGIANAVRSHLDARRATIATLKALGGSGRFVMTVYLAEVAMIAVVGIALGLLVGVALPMLAVRFVGHLIPVPIVTGIYPSALLLASAIGFLTALAFALWPLARARRISVRALYREDVAGPAGRPGLGDVALPGLAATALLGLVLATSADPRITLIFAGAAIGAMLLLEAIARLVMALARRLPRPREAGARLALANLHRPGALTPTVILSLGLGLTLVVALAQVDANLRRQLVSVLPDRAPSFFFLDIPSSEVDDFTALLRREAPQARVEAVPMLRGRIVSLRGVPAESYPVPPRFAWVLSGDRGITFSERLPENSSLASGAWWTADDGGPPRVSFEARVAEGLGLAVGDRITVNVLGRTIEAVIANTRRLEWESLGINFVMVFSPSTFRGAPHSQLATMTMPEGGSGAAERAVMRAVTTAFPQVAAVRVKEALEAVERVMGQLASAAAGASSVTLLSALVVLAGALAAGQAGRVREAVILKTLGATRGRLLMAYALEYLALGVAAALVGLVAGTAAAYVVVTQVMDLPFRFAPGVAVVALVVALVTTIPIGLAGTVGVLRKRPAPLLRAA